MHLTAESPEYYRLVDDHIEQIVDGALVRVELDGSASRVLATDINRFHDWLTDDILLTVGDNHILERVDITTGARERLATHVTDLEIVDDALYVLVVDSPHPADDGLWYLSPAALGLSTALD